MDIPEVNSSEAAAMREAGATWIDVREHSEWNAAHIEDTLHLPLGQAVEHLPVQWPELDTQLIISCLSGGRSGQLVAHLRTLGYTDVYNLAGGIQEWAAEGRAIVTDS
ncbi:MAG: rhodanese-like domain-containing protein [Gaiellales bacterium]